MTAVLASAADHFWASLRRQICLGFLPVSLTMDENVIEETTKSRHNTETDTDKDKNVNNTTGSSDDAEERIEFTCKSCGLHETVQYFGKQPPFVYGVEFCEPTYVMKDPFQPPIPKWKSKPEYFIALGAHCIRCNDLVCRDTKCSFYYKNTYCLTCAKNATSMFPTDIQQKIKKQLAAQR